MSTSPDFLGGTLVDTARIPGGGVLHLVQYGSDYEITLGDEQLMGNWATESERALATLVCERLGPQAELVLIGGLGMGFTLAAALQAAPAHVAIHVAELVPAVISWARGPLAHVFDGSLADPRVTIIGGDVHDVIANQTDTFDAILLDVDNGPDGMVTAANERLYSNWGLNAAYAALRRQGTLAIWSAYPDASFAERLQRVGFSVEEVEVPSGEPDDTHPHTIWLARKGD